MLSLCKLLHLQNPRGCLRPGTLHSLLHMGMLDCATKGAESQGRALPMLCLRQCLLGCISLVTIPCPIILQWKMVEFITTSVHPGGSSFALLDRCVGWEPASILL